VTRCAGPEDLAGKRVGTAGIPYQDAYLKAILARPGVDEGDVRKVDVGFNLTPSMLSGRVDATLGSFWNYEGVELQRRGERPTILRVERLGVPTYNELDRRRREEDARDRGQVLRPLPAGARARPPRLRDDPDAGVRPLCGPTATSSAACRRRASARRCRCSSPRTATALRMDGRARVAGLRRLDGRERPAQAAERSAAGADDGVPARRGGADRYRGPSSGVLSA
jgi:putative hydroxymethylpyrimidine transport system substrate-binding protein